MPVFTKMEDRLRWQIGNKGLQQSLELKAGAFSCVSLRDKAGKREWIHPLATSNEIQVEVEIGGEKVILTGQEGWQYVSHRLQKGEDGSRELTITLAAEKYPLRLTRHYYWPEALPLVRQWSVLENTGKEPIIVHRLDSIVLRVDATGGGLDLRWINNYCRGMHPNPSHPVQLRRIQVNAEQSVASGPYSPDCGWFCLQVPGKSLGLVGGWEWSGPFKVNFGAIGGPCLIQGGLESEGMAEPLAAGAAFTAPVVWYGCYQGELDEAAHLCHDFVRNCYTIAPPKENWPAYTYDSWAYSLDREKSPFFEQGTDPWFPKEPNILSQLEAAKEIGYEAFVLDYGWFPRVGDWWPDPVRHPQGGKPIAKAVHEAGMKMGIWMGFGNVDPQSKVRLEHPDWLAIYNGKPIPEDFFIRTGASVWGTNILCLGHKPAREWIKEQICRVLDEFEIDWLKHDFDTMTLCTSTEHSHTPGDNRIAACEAFYEIMDMVRSKYPHIICENWENDSALPDYGMIQRHHAHLIGDAYGAILLRQMYYGVSHIFPSDRLYRYLRFEDSKGEFHYILRSGYLGGPIDVMSDPRLMSDEQKRMLKEELGIYRRFRRFFSTGRLYRLIGRPEVNGWDGFEYWEAPAKAGVVFVFRNESPAAGQRVVMKGLNPKAQYSVERIDGKSITTHTGRELMGKGYLLELPEINTCEILSLTEIS
jgi:alpha-galactosidase